MLWEYVCIFVPALQTSYDLLFVTVVDVSLRHGGRHAQCLLFVHYPSSLKKELITYEEQELVIICMIIVAFDVNTTMFHILWSTLFKALYRQMQQKTKSTKSTKCFCLKTVRLTSTFQLCGVKIPAALLPIFPYKTEACNVWARHTTNRLVAPDEQIS